MSAYQTVVAYIHHLTQRLNTYYKDTVLSEQYAWWTLETITKKTGSHLLRLPLLQLSCAEKELIETWIHQMTHEHMPIQYLIGNVPFCDLTIIVKPPFLIPRPETEQWCANIIEKLRTCDAPTPLYILDLCSGTGCIGLAIAKAVPAHIVCADISLPAIELGRLNAQKNNIDTVTFIQSDLFKNLDDMKFDLIVSNPPYISEEEFQTLDASVTAWEDENALVAANHGYAIIDKIITQSPSFIRTNEVLKKIDMPQLVIEHGAIQSLHIVDLMRNTGYIHVQTHKDLSGKDRVVSGSLPDVVITNTTA